MTAMDILLALGMAEEAHIAAAAEFRQGRGKAKTRRLPGRKIWLIAALIAMTVILAGCAVVYLLRIQDMKVGQYSFYVPTVYDEQGNVIPVETQEPITQLSSQGSNMEALAEWVAFTNTYDQDGSIVAEADRAAKSGSPLDIPEQYYLTYGCYSQEMVDKLNEIVAKYDLQLLSRDVSLNYYENSVLFQSLGVDGLICENPDVQVEYLDGYFYLEGTFDMSMAITMDMGDWKWEDALAGYRYSRKDYFDPLTAPVRESHIDTQWDYTRKDGQKLLMVLGEETAKIFANLPDAFISITLDPHIWVDGEKVPMTQNAMEQLAELFDLSIKPRTTTMEQVEPYLEEARAKYDAQQAQAKAQQEAQREAKYAAGYREFVAYKLEKENFPEGLSYILSDLNGDGTEELVINGREILSMKGGQSYQYFDFFSTGMGLGGFKLCEGNVFEIYGALPGENWHYFYQAEVDGPVFITGVAYSLKDECLHRVLKDGIESRESDPITEEEAQAILDAYSHKDFDWLPLVKYGQPVTSVKYTEPYAKYIADKMDRCNNAPLYEYALLDVNGDGVEELITREERNWDGNMNDLALRIHSIQDGRLWDMNMRSFDAVCEGGVLVESEPEQPYWKYFRCTEKGAEVIEEIFRDRGTLYWTHIIADQKGKTVTEEAAAAVRNSYHPIELDWKPFGEYPFR